MIMAKDGAATTKLVTKQQPNNADKNSAKSVTDPTLEKLQGYIKEWIEYRKKLLPFWERDTKLYSSKRYKPGYKGIADSFVPMARSTVETIYSSIGTADMSTEFLPQDIFEYLKDRLMVGYTGRTEDANGVEIEETEEQYLVRAINNTIGNGIITDENLDVVNDLFKYVWDSGKWRKHVRRMIKSGLKIGNGVVWMTLGKNNLPKLEARAFEDTVFDPACTDDDNGRFYGYRYLSFLSDLKAETIVDPSTGKKRKRYNLKGVTAKTLYGDDDKTEKELKEELLFGTTTESNKDQVEVIKLYVKDREYTLVNRSVIAEDIENVFITQAKTLGLDTDDLLLNPLASWANFDDSPSLYIGESEISLMWQEQERLNDLTNQKSDAITQALLRQKRASPSLRAQSKAMETFGAVIWAEQGQYEPLPVDQVPSAAFAEETSIKNNIREVTSTDQVVKGVTSTADITATEAQLQVANSNERNDIKIDSLVDGPLDRIARLALQYFRLFITDPYIFTPREANGIRPTLYDPKKYNYAFVPKIALTVSAQNKKRQEQREAVEVYKLLIQDPTNNLAETKRIMLPKIVDLDADEIDKIITPQVAPATQDDATSIIPTDQPTISQGVPA